MAAELLAFVAVAALVIVTPGQDTALTIRNTLTGGRAGGVATALGVSTAQAIWTVATSAGLAALIVASEPVFVALRVAGAAYLVYLGAQSLSAALRGHSAPIAAKEQEGRGGSTPRALYRQGVLSNLANPKMAVFFTSLLPQFAPESGPAFLVLLALGLLFAAMTLLWLSAYAVAVARACHTLLRPRVRRALDAVTGTVLVALGLRVATTSRAG